MKHDLTARLGPPQLRSLLTLSRELLQTDDALGVLRLLGRGVAELTQADSALLLVRGGADDAIGFDERGVPVPALADHHLYEIAFEVLDGEPGGAASIGHHGRALPVLVLGVPVSETMAALAVGWDRDADGGVVSEREAILRALLELTVAALGKIETRVSLERLVSTQYEQMADSAEAHALELARRDAAENDIRVLSLTDVLTGLNNRRGFFVHAEHVFRVAQRRHASSAVIFADIDGLKRVNDGLGHDAGDCLIRDIATVFRETFREADVVGRLGGDEFVAYTLDDARPQIILARLERNLHAFNLMQERPYRLALSAGVVRCDPGTDQGLLKYVLQADHQMYAQKRRRLH